MRLLSFLGLGISTLMVLLLSAQHQANFSGLGVRGTDIKISAQEPKVGEFLKNTDFPVVVDKFQKKFKLEGTVYVKRCGTDNALYNPNTGDILICYEIFYNFVERLKALGFGEAEANSVAIDALIGVYAHEYGHKVVRTRKIPFTGSEEDAVDEFAAIYLIEMGRPEAVEAMAIWLKELTSSSVAQNHGSGPDRFYKLMCLGYGSRNDRSAPLSPDQLRQCRYNFQTAKKNWSRLLDL